MYKRRRNGRRRVEVLQHSVFDVCVCVAMFSETTGAVCPSHNKYIHVSPSPRLARSSRSLLPPPLQLRPQPPPPVLFRSSLPFNRKRHFIVLYTHTYYTYIQPLWRFNRETTTFRRPPVEYHRRHRFAPQTHHTYPPPPSHRPPPIFSLSKIYYHYYTGTWPPVDIFTEAVVVIYTRVYIIIWTKG